MVKLEKIKMTEQDLAEKKLHLASCKLQKDESDLMIKELESLLEAKIPTRVLEDDIQRITDDMEEKVIKDNNGNKIPATEADIERMKITINKLNEQKELDIPGRQTRFKLNQIREAKKRIDAPEKQIHKLEKEIREKSFYQPERPKQSTTMCD